MSLFSKLSVIWKDINFSFLVNDGKKIFFKEIFNNPSSHLLDIQKGDIVALIGDFDPISISNLINLIEKKTIIVPLTSATKKNHKYFMDTAQVHYVVEKNNIKILNYKKKSNTFIDALRKKNHAGLILFSSGTTGRQKAILHDFSKFLTRYEIPRKGYKTLGFLLFDHIGGINTFFHTIFNKGTIINCSNRSIENILNIINKNNIELLPTTPTFLRMLLVGGYIPSKIPTCLKIITYGTERMDQLFLNTLVKKLPDVDFRQTYGMSEIGILRVKSKARNSLFMKIGGEGIKIKVENKILKIKSKNRMLGYLNYKSPFDNDGWYNTRDIVETEGEYIKIIGRDSEIVNIGGLKFMTSDVEHAVLKYNNINFAKVVSKKNPITGQHIEIEIEVKNNFNTELFKKYLKNKLPTHMFPSRIVFKKK